MRPASSGRLDAQRHVVLTCWAAAQCSMPGRLLLRGGSTARHTPSSAPRAPSAQGHSRSRMFRICMTGRSRDAQCSVRGGRPMCTSVRISSRALPACLRNSKHRSTPKRAARAFLPMSVGPHALACRLRLRVAALGGCDGHLRRPAPCVPAHVHVHDGKTRMPCAARPMPTSAMHECCTCQGDDKPMPPHALHQCKPDTKWPCIEMNERLPVHALCGAGAQDLVQALCSPCFANVWHVWCRHTQSY
jgi:hypothetical protein